MRWAFLRSGIYARFIVAMAALALVPLAFMGVSLVNISSRGMQAAVLELHTKLAEKLAQGLEVYLKTVDDSIRFSISAVQKPNLSWKEKQDLLRSLIDSNPDVEEISVLDRKGQEAIKVYNPALIAAPALVSRAQDSGYLRFKTAHRRTLEVSPRIGAPPLLELYYPLSEFGDLRVALLLKSLWDSVGSERAGGTGFAIVVASDGHPLLYPPERLQPASLGSIPQWPIVSQALHSVSIGSSEYLDPAGVMQVGAYAPVAGLNWAVVIQQPKAEAYLSASKMKRTAVAVILVFVGAAILIAFWMARRLTQPLLAVTRAAAEVARGGFPEKVHIRTGDELQDLADTFNEMVAQLRKYAELHVDRLIREQQKTEAILFSIVDGILMTDNDGKIQLANRRARELLEAGPETVLESKTLQEAIKADKLRDAVVWMVARPGEALPKEVDLSTEDYRRFIRVSAQPVTLPGKGTKIGVVAALRDVTAEKQLDKMKEEFLHSITHDLRNPVGSIMGFSDFLMKGVVGVLNEQQSNMVSSISKSAARLLTLVNNILDLAKMEAGKIEVKLKPVSMAGVAGRVIEILMALAQKREETLELSATEEFMITADADLIERVFANLVGNAIKFADKRVTASVTDDGEFLRGAVVDDGVGIPAAYLGKIFEKFEQVPGQKQGGTGLGLTICRHIVEAHLGRIWVESEPGKGARFYFTIPKDLAYNEKGEVVRRPGVATGA